MSTFHHGISVTETQINSALPEAAHMAFDGLTLYVVEA